MNRHTNIFKSGVLIIGTVLVYFVKYSEEKCLQEIPDFQSKQHFVVDGIVHPLVIGGSTSSWRPSQAFTNQVLKILLQEVMGYGNVTIATDDTNVISTSQSISQVTGCSDASCGERVPRTARTPSIDAEVWLDDPLSLQPWMETQEIVDLGPSGIQARFGWYVSTALVTTLYSGEGLIVDHWRVLQNTQLTTYLTISTNEIEVLTKESSANAMFKGQRYCDRPECTNGVYYPPWCAQDNSQCVILLADYPESNFDRLTNQIQSLGLMVGVAWIGPNLKSTVQQRQERNQPTLFFGWTPHDQTSSGAFSRVAFPSCQEDAANTEGGSGGCDFPWQNVNKVVWRPLVIGAPYVYDLLKDVQFSSSKMEGIMYSYYFSWLSVAEFACQWVQRNRGTWEPWIPSGAAGIKRTILLGGLFDTLIDPTSPNSGIEPGARMAVEAVNADPNILPSYKLALASLETGCSPEESVLSYLKFYEDRGQSLAGLVGPMCSSEAEVVGSVSRVLNTVVISYQSDSPSLADKDQFPYYYRTFPDTTEQCYALTKLFQNFGWGRYALLSDSADMTFKVMKNMEEVMMESGIEMVLDIYMDINEVDQAAVSSYLEEIVFKKAHMVVGYFPENVARMVLCEAYRQGVTGEKGYQWFLPDWYQDAWWDTDYHNKHSPTYSIFSTSPSSFNISCTTVEMMQAIQGYISLSRAYIANWDQSVPGQLTVERWINEYNSLIEKEGKMPSTYAAYAYDTVWTYAYALDELLQNDMAALDTLSSQQTIRTYLRHLSNTSFSGVTGEVQFMDQDRRGPVSIRQHHPPSTTIIGTYIPDMATKDQGSLSLNTSGIVWASGSQPTDGANGPTCMVEGLRQALGSDCRTAIALMNTILLLVILISTIILAVFIKRRYDKKVKRTQQHIKQLTLMGLGEGALITLDEWEMPRENVVLNRKLGEGAFGTVYGGEALLDDSKWAAVAVKTLKLGASVEEKLDFLSEAEVMKRFNHQNIVNLLGVCTRGEPMYAVMEFMLYGDLKTFLLGRRHLVGEGSAYDRNRQIMGPDQLTSMVLDIASGLSYLASINYVHRDLACRNCLVDASYSVKIGDFGMTRALYDSDYYRLGKRSKLPVRWMAPESLTEGIFTTMSDVWSLGVVIYEVVTFGSFPYQELSNAEVLDYIRNRNSLRPPEGCSPALGALMMQCWAIQPQHRPTAKDVTDILCQRPHLITPCLGVPLGSMPPEEIHSTGLPLTPVRPKHPAPKHSTRSNSSTDMHIGREFSHVHDDEFLTGHLASVGHIFRASKRKSNKRNFARCSFELGPSGSRRLRHDAEDDRNRISLISSTASAPSTSMSNTSTPSTSQDSCVVAVEDLPPVIHRGRSRTSATLEHNFLHRLPSGGTFTKLLKKAATEDNIYSESKQNSWSLFGCIDSEKFDGLPLLQQQSSRRGSKRPRSKSLGSKSSGSKSPCSKHSLYVTLSRNGFDDSKEEETMISFVSN